MPLRSSLLGGIVLLAIACGSSSAGPAAKGTPSDDASTPDDASVETSDGAAGATPDASSDGAAVGDDASIGDGASVGDGAGSGAAAYNPCPAAGTPCAIMPLGDSITYGYQSTTLGGYRVPMFDAAVKAGKSITFVGSQMTGPATVDGMPFPQENEGHSGYTIADGGGRTGIQGLVQNAIATYHPNIVTLMIGTNDVDIMLDLANAPTRLGTLLDTILAADPKLLLVVAQITPTQSDSENTLVEAYNAAIPALVASRAKAGKHILMVDMYSAITADPAYKTDYMANALHPTDAGFVVIGGVWDAAIASLFR